MTDTEEERSALLTRTDAIEEAYEFMLAYAAQGRAGGDSGANEIRDFLQAADNALDGLAKEFDDDFAGRGTIARETYAPFLEVLEQDARSARASVQLVLAQATISSQLIDSLNASIHLRALLTDMFLIDEVMRPLVDDTPET